MNTKLLVILLAFIVDACLGKGDGPEFTSGKKPPSHQLWTELLQEHVTSKGRVDYEGVLKDSVKFNQYLSALTNTPPDDNQWTEEERLAYWINVYNAYTLKIVLDNYPVESIKDISPTITIPTVNDVFTYEFIPIGDKTLSLNVVEHGIIREFGEPRIHFAVNCASISCPRLRNEAYDADRLDEQLDDQTRYFLLESGENEIEKNKLVLSKIFKWYEDDFKESGGVLDFIDSYTEAEISKDAKIEYKDYNWKLNSLENGH